MVIDSSVLPLSEQRKKIVRNNDQLKGLPDLCKIFIRFLVFNYSGIMLQFSFAFKVFYKFFSKNIEITIVLSTHDRSQVDSFAQQILLLDHGKLTTNNGDNLITANRSSERGLLGTTRSHS